MQKPLTYLMTSAFVTLILCIAPARAQIVLTINPAEETWELSGSDAGNVEWSEGFAQVFWTVSDLGTDGDLIATQQAPAFEVTGWAPPNNSVITLEFAGDSTFSVFLAGNTTTDINGLPITVTALGGSNDYSKHSDEFKEAFENLIGSTIPLANGTNFGDILVQGLNIITLGDANDDGLLSNLDIASFVLALTNPVAYQAMHPNVDPDIVLDMNGDGFFSNLDIADFVAALTGGRKN